MIEITVVRGRQGIARMPGLGTQITDNAHALAMGKVVLARLRPAALARYVGSGLTRYTPSTITSPDALARELREVRADGYAVEREEFDRDFCCVAAPVLDEHGRLAGVLGLSASTRAFDAEHAELAAAVRDLAAEARGRTPPDFQHRAEKHAFLVAHRTGHSLPSSLLSTPGCGDEGGPCTPTRRRSRQ